MVTAPLLTWASHPASVSPLENHLIRSGPKTRGLTSLLSNRANLRSLTEIARGGGYDKDFNASLSFVGRRFPFPRSTLNLLEQPGQSVICNQPGICRRCRSKLQSDLNEVIAAYIRIVCGRICSRSGSGPRSFWGSQKGSRILAKRLEAASRWIAPCEVEFPWSRYSA
jgi:hypothetical protein